MGVVTMTAQVSWILGAHQGSYFRTIFDASTLVFADEARGGAEQRRTSWLQVQLCIPLFPVDVC